MKTYYILNNEGFILEVRNLLPKEGELYTEKDYAVLPNPIKLKFDFDLDEWIDAATPEEIAELNKVKIPFKVAKANCKLALIHFGISTSLITKAIHDMPPSLQKDKMIILWEDTNDFYRKDESLNAMAPIFNITQELLDQVFIYADSL